MSLRAASLRLLLGSTLALAACSGVGASGPAVEPELVLHPLPQGLLIVNDADRRAFYALVPQRVLPLFDLAACVDELHCASVAPHAAVTATWPAAPASEPDFRLFWWRSVDDGHGGQRADSVRWRDVIR